MQLQFMPDQTKKKSDLLECVINCYINMLTLGARSSSDFVLSYGLSDIIACIYSRNFMDFLHSWSCGNPPFILISRRNPFGYEILVIR